MKKHFLCGLVAVLFAASVFVGCTSTPIGFEDNSPVIVVSVTGNQTLPWLQPAGQVDYEDADDGDGILSTLVNKLIHGDDVELTSGRDRLDYAADSIHQLLAENGGAEVMSHEDLLATDSYQNAKESILNVLDTKIAATDYKNLIQMGAKNARMLMQDAGAKSLMIVDFTFRKSNISGNRWNGKAAAYVIMKVRFLNEKGKELVNREYTATSIDSVPIISRKYDKEALVDLFPETIDAAINKFVLENL